MAKCVCVVLATGFHTHWRRNVVIIMFSLVYILKVDIIFQSATNIWRLIKFQVEHTFFITLQHMECLLILFITFLSLKLNWGVLSCHLCTYLTSMATDFHLDKVLNAQVLNLVVLILMITHILWLTLQYIKNVITTVLSTSLITLY